MALSLEQQELNKQRNAKIYERYNQLSESQPLAYDYTIFSALAQEFGLTQQTISLIVRKAQKEQQQ